MLQEILVAAIWVVGLVSVTALLIWRADRYFHARLEKEFQTEVADEAKAEKTRERRIASDLEEAVADERARLERATLIREAAEQDALTSAIAETRQDLIDGRRAEINALTAARVAQAPETARLEAEAGVAGMGAVDTAALAEAYKAYASACTHMNRGIAGWKAWLGEQP